MVNNLNMELAGKVIVILPKYLKPKYHAIEERLFLCKSGFGCHPDTNGRAVFGTYLKDGESTRIEGYWVERLATDDELKLLGLDNEKILSMMVEYVGKNKGVKPDGSKKD